MNISSIGYKVFAIFIKLMVGFFVASLGIVFMINANLGLSPWDVLHQGLTNIINITIGQASMLAGVIVVIISAFLGVKIGIGTILNIIFIGNFMDIIIESNLIPVTNNIFVGLIMLLVGMILLGLGTCIYMRCELGCGPRDGLMTALTKITGKPVKVIRTTIEVCALICGWFLGGFVGIGTVITALLLGYIIQVWCKLLRLNIADLNHSNVMDSFKIIYNGIKV